MVQCHYYFLSILSYIQCSKLFEGLECAVWTMVMFMHHKETLKSFENNIHEIQLQVGEHFNQIY